MPIIRIARAAACALPSLIALLPCAAFAGPDAAPSPGESQASITLDGVLNDWTSDAGAVADGRFVHFRFDPAVNCTLQSGPVTTEIWIDADGDVRTGAQFNPPAGAPDPADFLSADVRVLLSPPDEKEPGKLGYGVRVVQHITWDETRPLGHADIGFAFLPTHSSHAFEARIDRAAIARVPGLGDIAKAGRVEIRVLQREPGGKIVWTSEPLLATTSNIEASRALADITLPPKPAGTARILVYNVLWGSPEPRPEPFARVLRALDPDLVLAQEWDRRPYARNGEEPPPRILADDLVAWFDEHVREADWRAVIGEQRGVAVITPHPLRPLPLSSVSTTVGGDAGELMRRMPRSAGAVIETPAGEIAAVSVHLKCCGSAGSWEDMNRMAEALSINLALREALASRRPDALVVAGDFNLVGSRAPLEILAGGLDVDGSALDVVDAQRLGAREILTWREADSAFTPGRLDYALVDGSAVEIVQAFILDTEGLTDAALERSGLQRSDTAASDHLPMVIDIRPR